ncbi:MAG: hypothetical protein Q9P01_08015 [Anaerolineae bacterium]|nr:hypothetical protein [Anaerolineae bacterium]
MTRSICGNTLPDGVILMARSAKNRVLHYLPPEDAHANRKYGDRASGTARYLAK